MSNTKTIQQAKFIFFSEKVVIQEQVAKLVIGLKKLGTERYKSVISLGGAIPSHVKLIDVFETSEKHASLFAVALEEQKDLIMEGPEKIEKLQIGDLCFSSFFEDAKFLKEEDEKMVLVGLQSKPTSKSVQKKIILLHVYRIFGLLCEDENEKQVLCSHIYTLETSLGITKKTCAFEPQKLAPFIIEIEGKSREVGIQEIPPGKALQAVFYYFFGKELPDRLVSGVSNIKDNPQMEAILNTMKPLLEMLINPDPSNMSQENIMKMMQSFGMGAMGNMFKPQ